MNTVIFKVAASTKPFVLYRSDINDDIPADAVEISFEEYELAVSSDANTFKDGVISNVPIAFVFTWDEIRSHRDRLISFTGFEYERNGREGRLGISRTRSNEWMAELDAYVQALAEIPQVFKTPNEVVWPEIPV
jgi:hypothetical protein